MTNIEYQLQTVYPVLVRELVKCPNISNQVIDCSIQRFCVRTNPTTLYNQRGRTYNNVCTRYSKEKCIKGDINELCSAIALCKYGYSVHEFAEDVNQQTGNIDIICKSDDIILMVQCKTLVYNDFNNDIFRVYSDWIKWNCRANLFIASNYSVTNSNILIDYVILTSDHVRDICKKRIRRRTDMGGSEYYLNYVKDFESGQISLLI